MTKNVAIAFFILRSEWMTEICDSHTNLTHYNYDEK